MHIVRKITHQHQRVKKASEAVAIIGGETALIYDIIIIGYVLLKINL